MKCKLKRLVTMLHKAKMPNIKVSALGMCQDYDPLKEYDYDAERFRKRLGVPALGVRKGRQGRSVSKNSNEHRKLCQEGKK